MKTKPFTQPGRQAPPPAPAPRPAPVPPTPVVQTPPPPEPEPELEPDLLDPADAVPIVSPTNEPPQELTLAQINKISADAEKQAHEARFAGKTEAECIIIRAHMEAESIIANARRKAQNEYSNILAQATVDAARFKKA